jgi:hypothetical protein
MTSNALAPMSTPLYAECCTNSFGPLYHSLLKDSTAQEENLDLFKAYRRKCCVDIVRGGLYISTINIYPEPKFVNRPVREPYLTNLPARLHRLSESIP